MSNPHHHFTRQVQANDFVIFDTPQGIAQTPALPIESARKCTPSIFASRLILVFIKAGHTEGYCPRPAFPVIPIDILGGRHVSLNLRSVSQSNTSIIATNAHPPNPKHEQHHV